MPRIDVVIPFHNAAPALAETVESVARYSAQCRLILVDDGSTEPRIQEIVSEARRVMNEAVSIRVDANEGFVRAANRGLKASDAPFVVLLNSDTVVTRGWLDKLVAAARSRPNVATVTPLTNNGTICSVPIMNAANEIPEGYDVDTFAELIDSASLRLYPPAPTAVGFCMLITREALDKVGAFDEAFGTGYGEENDFCQRAIAAGFVNLIADDTFVYHKGGASFGDAAAGLRARNLAIVNAKHPDYADDIDRFCRNDPLAAARSDIGALAAALRGSPVPKRKRVLHVLHEGGGTEKHARDLARVDAVDVVSYVSTCDGSRLNVDEYFRGTRRRGFRFPLETTLGFNALEPDPAYRRAFETLCRAIDVDLIHVHHLARNTVDIATVAAELGIPYVMTLHDYHTLCPSYTLIDPDGVPCGACIGRPAPSGTAKCLSSIGRQAGYVAEHQERTRRFLGGAARIFAPSNVTRAIVAGAFTELGSRIRVVEHGGIPAAGVARIARGSRSLLNVAVLGGLEQHKGLRPFRRLLRANKRQETVFHLYGWPHDAALRTVLDQPVVVHGSHFVYHGPYEADRIVATLQADRIHVGLQLSIWDEAFSYTVSEFAAAGIPVIAGRLGAQGERVQRASLGWTVSDPMAADEILALLDRLVDEPAFRDDAVAAMRLDLALPSLEVMWETYVTEYRAILEGGTAMRDRQGNPTADAVRYASYLAQRLAEGVEPEVRARDDLARARAEVAALQERLRSPRHRVADAAAGILHKIPVVWPLVAKVTDAIVGRRKAQPPRG